MFLFVRKILNFLFSPREKYESLGTYQYCYANSDGVKFFTISATFFMTLSGERKIELDYDKDYSLAYSPYNHQFYHTICIPYMKKTAPFDFDNDTVRLSIINMCSENNKKPFGLSDITKPKAPKKDRKKKDDITNNIIDFFDFNRDK